MVSSSSTPASSASEIADLRSRIPQCRCVWKLRAFTATFEPRHCNSTWRAAALLEHSPSARSTLHHWFVFRRFFGLSVCPLAFRSSSISTSLASRMSSSLMLQVLPSSIALRAHEMRLQAHPSPLIHMMLIPPCAVAQCCGFGLHRRDLACAQSQNLWHPSTVTISGTQWLTLQRSNVAMKN